MKDKSDRTFRPQLETFEERDLLSSFSSLFPAVRQFSSLASLGESARFLFTRPNFTFSPPTLANGGSPIVLTAGSSPATTVHTLVNTGMGSQFSYSLVPTQMAYGLTNLPSTVTLAPSFDPGLTTAGLIAPATLRSDPGFNFLV